MRVWICQPRTSSGLCQEVSSTSWSWHWIFIELAGQGCFGCTCYARAHPFEDADPSSLSAQAGEPALAAQQELGEQQLIYVDETPAFATSHGC